MRIASPYRLRASRFDHVFVASLQDGEFPRRDRGEDPFLSEAQRLRSASSPAATPTPRSATSSTPAWRCRAGGSSSPTATATRTASPSRARPSSTRCRRLLEPAAGGEEPRPGRGGLTVAATWPRSSTRRRGALRGRAGALVAPAAPRRREALLAEAGVRAGSGERLARLAAARGAEAASRAPGPLANPAVLDALAAVPAYGGTTLEGFDVCSYRWFVSHELDPQPLDPAPDPLVQGGVMHAVLDRLYRERPGGDPLPRPGLARRLDRRGRASWSARSRTSAASAPTPPSGRSRAGSRACWPASSPTRPGARPAASSPGCSRPASARTRRPNARCSRSTAGGCTARSTGSTATPTAARSSSTTSSPAWSPRARSSRSRRSCSCSST